MMNVQKFRSPQEEEIAIAVIFLVSTANEE